VVGADKARRLAALNRQATVRCAVDSLENARQFSGVATESGVCIPVLLEVDIGMKRCGVPPGTPACELARELSRLPGLRFDGLQAYEGHVVDLPDPAERRRKTCDAVAQVIETRRVLERAGLPVAMVSGGGTGTYDITGSLDGMDEVQCGSYALMDWSYARVRTEFVVARWILATIVSSHPGYSIADVGAKGLGCEFGRPLVAGRPEAEARSVSEEHTTFDGLQADVGDTVRLVPSHGCTTQNLYRRMWIMRSGTIVDLWPIAGSGCLE
jgi:D-serine deaminase-like pyridoxal phosphate-dependent protein